MLALAFRARVGVPCIGFVILLAACRGTARESIRAVRPEGYDATLTEWRLTFDAHDEISIEHVENLLERAGLSATTRSSSSAFVPAKFTFSGAAAVSAHDLVTSDPSWPEIETRKEGQQLVERLRAERPVITDLSVEAAVAELTRTHRPAVEVLRDWNLMTPENGASFYRRQPANEPLTVTSMTVLDRTLVDHDGRRRVGSEVLLRVRTQDGRWRRVWVGQVCPNGETWRLRTAQEFTSVSGRR